MDAICPDQYAGGGCRSVFEAKLHVVVMLSGGDEFLPESYLNTSLPRRSDRCVDENITM